MESPISTGGPFLSSSLLPTPADKQQLMSLLRSNSVPVDRSRFDVVIASSRSEVARYDTEIRRLQRLLDRMTSERAELLDYTAGCRSLFSPIRRLPTEIITEIFALCSPGQVSFFDPMEETPGDMFGRSSQSHLLRLSQASSHWRDIIMQTPWLWATIAVDCPEPGGQAKRTTALLSRSLERSGSCLLAVGCIGNSMDGGALELLAQHSARWQTADIYLNKAAADSLSSSRGNFSNLKRLKIGGFGPRSNLFSTASKLTHVTLAISQGMVPDLPWAELRQVDFYFLHQDPSEILSVLTIMGACSSGCVFNVYRLDLGLLAHQPPLAAVVSDIQALSLSLDGSRARLGEILKALTLPRLQKLTIWSCFHWPRDHFPAFASQSSFPSGLTSLSLHDTVISEDDLAACLSEMDALAELFIQDFSENVLVTGMLVTHMLVTDSLLRRLTWTADSSCLVPHLSSMRFASFFSFRSQALLVFITSRLHSGRKGGVPFEMDLSWQTAQEPQIEDSVLAHILQLRDDRKLRWQLERHETD
ncbi:hypothetical protein C8R47DRAFT_1315994 [Mycena vitilis]|nr:hypothetical protein C8R47DRAFT_1315994 [Mycena vitilis]